MNITLVTKAWGRENSWTFGSCSSSQRYANEKEYIEKCCLFPGDHILTCKDSYGDGWHGGYIEIQGERYCEDFKSGREETTKITVTGIDENNNFLFLSGMSCRNLICIPHVSIL